MDFASLRSRLAGWLAPALAVLAGALCLGAGWLTLPQAGDLLQRTGPVLLFVVAMTIVTELADAAGVFSALTSHVAGWVSRPVVHDGAPSSPGQLTPNQLNGVESSNEGGRAGTPLRRGPVLLLWLLVAALATVSTIFLSLDTTALLITPLVVLLAKRAGLNPLLFALTTVWLANTASLLLPVSNLTNLLAQNRLHTSPAGFAALLWAPALVGIIVPLAVLAVLFRKALRGSFTPQVPAREPDRALLVIAGVVVLALLPALVSGLPVALPACAAALLLLLVILVRRRSALRWSMIPWQAVLLAAGLFVVVQTLQEHSLPALLRHANLPGDSLGALLSVSALGAVSSNVINNLPAYLALEPVAGSPLRLASLLIGTNLGPEITPWASLATLLWHGRLNAAGVQVKWGYYMLLGVPLAVLLVVLGTLAVWLTAGMPT